MPFIYPTSAERLLIESDRVARTVAGRLPLSFMPIRNVNAATVEFTIRDNVRGLQQLRGLDGSPPNVRRQGDATYSYEPGVWGEFVPLRETELMKRAGSAPEGTAIDVTDLIVEAENILAQREADRLEMLLWQVMLQGRIEVPGQTGNTFVADFEINQVVMSDWSNAATGTPLSDLLALSTLGRGTGATFDGGAQLVVSQQRANDLLLNRNANDLGGRLANNGSNIASLPTVNQFLVANGAPQITVYDQGYFDDANVFQLFVPDNQGALIGRRFGSGPIGEYIMTRNMNAPGYAPGSYSHVKDMTGNAPAGQVVVPASIEVHRGHNGGPVIYYPSNLRRIRFPTRAGS